MKPPAAPEGLVDYLAALTGQAPAGQLLELRYRRPRGMGQRFFDVERPDAAAAAVTALGRRRDVYIAPALRRRRGGTRDAVAAGWTLWADCDGPDQLAALEGFDPAPTIVVRSGTGPNRHAYWPLTRPLSPAALKAANKRLVHVLGADPACTHPAALLRPPNSLNFKHDPPTKVTLERFTGERFETLDLLAQLPALPQPAKAAAPASADSTDDPLRAIDPAVYVTALTGREPGRDRKITCPLHEDRTPSLHVYNTPEDGWYCFGCRRGRDVYHLGGALFGLCTRGREFVELRRRLYELLLPGREPPAPRRRRGRHVPSGR